MNTLRLSKPPVLPIIETRAFDDPTTMIPATFDRWVDQKFGIAMLKVEEGSRFIRGVRMKAFVPIQAKFSPSDSSNGDRAFKTRDGTLYAVPSVH